MGIQDETSIYEVKIAAPPDLAGLRFIDPLLREAERICGRQKPFTSCNRSNLPAQCLFEKCGFQRSGQLYNLDESDPELIYFKAPTP